MAEAELAGTNQEVMSSEKQRANWREVWDAWLRGAQGHQGQEGPRVGFGVDAEQGRAGWEGSEGLTCLHAKRAGADVGACPLPQPTSALTPGCWMGARVCQKILHWAGGPEAPVG